MAGDVNLFAPDRLVLVSGPCVVEDRDTVLRIAEGVRKVGEGRDVTVVFKASYDKANRTSPDSYRGPGMERALAILQEVRDATGLPVDTDVHETGQVARVAEVADVLQIPAFLCRQTDLIQAAAATGRHLLVKKGQFMAPEDMEHAVRKAEAVEGHGPVALVERGTTFGYRNLVVDFRSLPLMRRFAPVVFDGTHSVQRPGGLGGRSGGDREMVPYLVRAAAAVGVDGIFLETHTDPAKALSDGPNMIPLAELGRLLDDVLRIRESLS